MKPMTGTKTDNHLNHLRKPQRRGRRSLTYADTELSVLIQHFHINNQSEGKEPPTVEWYDQVLGRILGWLKERNLPGTLGSIDEPVIREFLIFL